MTKNEINTTIKVLGELAELYAARAAASTNAGYVGKIYEEYSHQFVLMAGYIEAILDDTTHLGHLVDEMSVD